MLEVLPSPVRPLSFATPDPRLESVDIPGGEADLWSPRGFSRAPRLLLIHGANPEGKDDPRVRRLARALARSGREVLVPQLGLRHQKLDQNDLNRIRESIRFRDKGERVGILAFSYGAGLALVVLAGDPEIQRRVEFIATVGTFFDLTHLVQGVTTGKVPYRRSLVPWKTIDDARDRVAEQLASFVGGDDAAALLAAWKKKNPTGLGPDTLPIYELLDNRDPSRVSSLVAALPQRLRELLNSLSPSHSVEKIEVPVFALHSGRDRAAPATESRLLVEALEGRVKTRLIEVEILEHVSPVASPFARLGDGVKLAEFAGLLLGEQEGWPRI